MKSNKFHSLVLLFVVFSMVLSACKLFSKPIEENHLFNSQEKNIGVNEKSYNANSPTSDNDASSTALGEPQDTMPSVGTNIAPGDLGGPVASEKGSGGIGISPPANQYISPPPDQRLDSTFENYGVNPFIDTEDDHLSTFGVDVDTGSYTIARSYIQEGFLPPEDAIRVEEFINYFPQGYRMPSERDVFEISIDGAPSPFTETDRYEMLRVGVQGYDVSKRDRKPVSLTFVIDVSGSMANGYRLELVKDSLRLLVEQLNEDDQVSIVAYSTTAWVELEPTPGDETRIINKAIKNLYPMNSTNAEAGLVLGYEMAARAFLPYGINRVVLCSDGVANVGNTGPDSIWEQIKYQASEGITMTAIGVGMGNYNDVLLEQLADHGDGFYAYIDTYEEAERLFVRDLVSTLQVIAMDAKIQIDFNPETVSRYRLVGYENRDNADADFRNDKVDAAEIGAGHNVTALYEFKLFPGAKGEIATVHLRWEDPETGRVYEITERYFTNDQVDSFREASPYLQLDVLVAEFAEVLRNSFWADGDIETIMHHSENLFGHLEEPEIFDFMEMLEEAYWLLS